MLNHGYKLPSSTGVFAGFLKHQQFFLHFEARLFGAWPLGSIPVLLRRGTLEELGRPMGAETDALN